MSIEFIATSAIAILGIIASVLFTPYTTFLFTARPAKLEKNLLLRQSLHPNERTKELDYIIKKQSKKYVEKNVRKEIKPHPFFRLAFFFSNFLGIFTGLLVVRMLLPKEIPFIISIPKDFSINIFIALIMFGISVLMRIILNSKAKEIEYNYGYYAAYLLAPRGILSNSEELIYKVPKYSLTERFDPNEIISHERICIHLRDIGMAHVFKRKATPPGAGYSSIYFGNYRIAKNRIIAFYYQYEETVLADEIFKKSDGLVVVNYQEEKPNENLDTRVYNYLRNFNNILKPIEVLKIFMPEEHKLITGFRQVKNNAPCWIILTPERILRLIMKSRSAKRITRNHFDKSIEERMNIILDTKNAKRIINGDEFDS